MNTILSYIVTLLATMNKRLLLILYVFDNLVLAILTLGNCKVGETISSVMWNLEVDKKILGVIGRPVVDFIMSPLESDHCKKAYRTYLLIVGAL